MENRNCLNLEKVGNGCFQVVILNILLALIACNNPAKIIKERYPDGTPAIVYEYPAKRDTLTFVLKIYYPDGNIQHVYTIENGKYVGNLLTYYSNGKLYEVDSLFAPRMKGSEVWDGTITRFYDNGILSEQFLVKHGHIDGISKHYDSKGVLVKEYYLEDTIKNGEYKVFYESGNVMLKATYSNDIPTGFAYFFKENGDTLKYYALNSKGEMSFPYKKWLENGKILEGKFLDTTKENAIWKWFDLNGKEIKRKIEHSKSETFISPE